MEKEDDFINASVILKELENKLSHINESELALKHSEAHRDIELQFEKYLKALALRKDALLHEVDTKYEEQKLKLENQQSKLKDSYNTCKKLMEAGVTIYKQQRNAALYCWKGANELKCDTERPSTISITFSDAILPMIESQGIVFLGTTECTPSGTKFNKAGTVSTMAGSTDGYLDGLGALAQFSSPVGISLNPFEKCLYVTDSSNNMIRRITLQGEVSTLAGKKKDGPFHYPAGINFYRNGQCFFVASQNHTIQKIATNGTVTLFAGSGKEGSEDGVGTSASFKHPTGIAIDQQTGFLYVTDCGNNAIRKITPEGMVQTLVFGQAKHVFFDGFGAATPALNNPYGLCYYEKEHALIICDYGNNRLQKLPLIGNGKATTMCEISKPACVAVTACGIIFVSAQNKIFKVTHNAATGKHDVETLVGTNKHGCVDGNAAESTFNHPTGLFICEATNTLFVADHLNSRIRKISLVP